MASGSDLDLDAKSWYWVLCLTLPLRVETLDVLQLLLRPYKWTRYAIGIVVGAEGTGDLSSTGPNSLNIVD